MKNLFYNVPARRNFLKSNAAEMRHVVDEFIRIALAFPSLFFSLTSNGQQVFYLEAGSLKQRIVQVLGNNYNAKLVTVKEHTDYLNVYGFVGKPETAKKTRGDQYFFVNNRFIKSAYLNHAVMTAYQQMIAPDAYPTYVLFIELNPEQLDVNVHPTKQEIKFEDEKVVYAFVQAAVKHALAQFSITPTLDFDLDASIQSLESIQKPFTEEKQAAALSSSLFQTFTQAHQAHFIESGTNGVKHWSGLSQEPSEISSQTPEEKQSWSSLLSIHYSPFTIHEGVQPVQLFNTYILLPTEQSFLLIHQQAAHERILYERLQQAANGKAIATQRSLFPVTIELAAADAVLITELLPDLQQLGYTIEAFGKNTFVIQGVPADVGAGNEKMILEQALEQYKHFSSELKSSKREMLIRSLATQQSIKAGISLSENEMQTLVHDLFSCAQPNSTPNGKPTYLEFKRESLEKMFGKT
ncbi:MAG: DNA mismatch repair protein MutL, partial [Flavisolibacter sp.]|nr:DNA mismatch repair protein MutL [Flavisolibacter sp.]